MTEKIIELIKVLGEILSHIQGGLFKVGEVIITAILIYHLIMADLEKHELVRPDHKACIVIERQG